MQEEHGGPKGARWPGAETGRPRTDRGKAGQAGPRARGSAGRGQELVFIRGQREGRDGKQAVRTEAVLETARAHWVQNRWAERRQQTGCEQPTPRRHRRLVNIRVVEVIRLVDVKYLGTDTPSTGADCREESRWGRMSTRADPQGSGLRGKPRGYQERGRWEEGDQTAVLSLSGLRCP